MLKKSSMGLPIMTTETTLMSESVAWLVEWENGGKTWVQAHASEVRAREQAVRQNGRVTELCAIDQAEAYKNACVREALEETANNVLASDPLATRRGLAAAIRASIPE